MKFPILWLQSIQFPKFGNYLKVLLKISRPRQLKELFTTFHQKTLKMELFRRKDFGKLIGISWIEVSHVVVLLIYWNTLKQLKNLPPYPILIPAVFTWKKEEFQLISRDLHWKDFHFTLRIPKYFTVSTDPSLQLCYPHPLSAAQPIQMSQLMPNTWQPVTIYMSETWNRNFWQFLGSKTGTI